MTRKKTIYVQKSSYFCILKTIRHQKMKTIRILSFSILLSGMMLFCGCRHEQRPADVMDEAEMVSFLKDAYLLEGFFAIESGFQYDSLHNEMVAAYDSLLVSHGLTREDFERSVDYYTRHPHDYQLIHQQVVDALDSAINAQHQ